MHLRREIVMRAILSGLCLFVVAGFATAEERKTDTKVTGRFKEWKNGQLILLVGKKGEEKESVFKVKDDARVSLQHDNARMGDMPAFIAHAVLHADVPMTIGLDKEKNIVYIAADMKAVVGRFKEWRDGELVLLVGAKGKEKEMAYKVRNDAPVSVSQSGSSKNELGRDAFKNLKGTDQVILTFDDKDNIRAISVDRR